MKDKESAAFRAKWREENVVRRGFTCVPKCLITCMGELGLKLQEAAVLLNIVEHCWYEGEKAWPAVNSIARNIGRKNSSTRVSLASLERKGFITKEQRFNDTNLYGLQPCIEKLAEHMKTCRHTAGKTNGYRQNSGGEDSQETSDYIDSHLNRNTNINTSIYSQSVINDHSDQTSNSFGKCFVGGRHRWREFEKERTDGIYFYFICINEGCGKQFHKKNEKPWPVEYPHINSD